MSRRRVARAAFVLRRLPGSLWQAALQHRALRRSAAVDVCGFDVRLWRLEPDDGKAVVERVTAALELMRAYDPRRFERMRRDCRHILVGPTGGAFFWVLTRVCALDVKEVLKRSPSMLALIMVHEAAHARITAAGVYPSSPIMQRLEQRCVREQISFALLLQRAGFGGTERVLEWLHGCLTADPWWTADAMWGHR